jgi:hypothetical protein
MWSHRGVLCCENRVEATNFAFPVFQVENTGKDQGIFLALTIFQEHKPQVKFSQVSPLFV